MYFQKTYLLIAAIFLTKQFSAQSIGGTTTGASLYCDSINSGFISLTNFNGAIVHWEMSTNNGQNWTHLLNTTSTQSYNRLKKTTSFRAIVQDGTAQADTSSISTLTVYVAGNAGILTGGGAFCEDAGNGQISLSSAPGPILYWQYSVTNGSNWIKINSTSTPLTYSSITESSLYRVVVKTVDGCPDDTTSTIVFKIQPKTIPGNILNADSVCYGEAGDTLHLSDFSGKLLNWFSSIDNGSNWTQLSDTTTYITYTTVTKSFWYKATVKNGICPMETTTPAIVALYNTNPANAGEDVTITRHEKITLRGSGNGFASWNNPEFLSDRSNFNPTADPMNTTNYVLTLKDLHGCITKDSVTVNVIVPIPTAISPNGDGVNDYFEIDKIDTYPNNSLIIFNRWGKQIFNASPYNNSWNGKSEGGHDLPDDQYYYVFDFGNGEKPVTNYILIKR
ncbi:gliding motility-associated C-terminal domain-containing protein [Aurantibacillus circumpalustris]|uniref:gliding motility-associated C-terminal domain-containing protein n=1 Tax=Aurantibacillus circumpalustris TaxID=3036359 RepID=UPI00295B638C|nr:gliding motility-associated C-terminal domain-containing protein [Aurantibacillus circumpalustris]